MQVKKGSLRKFVAVDPSKCTGCGICEFICVLEKHEPISPLRSRIHVIRVSPLLNIVTICRFCENAPCVRACPRDALVQSESGVIVVDESKCNLCVWCVEACPYGGITLHPDKSSVLTCDLCNGEPKCVEFCPEEALKLVSSDEEVETMWKISIRQVSVKIEKLANLVKRREVLALFEGMEERTERFNQKFKEMDRRYARAVGGG